MLLRSDIHTLFDQHELSIEPVTRTLRLSEKLRKDNYYKKFHGAKLFKDFEKNQYPASDALEQHWKNFNEKNE